MKVSIIIPFRSFSGLVKGCIESAKHQSHRDVEIITVSDRERLDVKGVKSIFNPKLDGVGKKRNAGARAASGDVLFFLDSDCELKRDTVARIVKMFRDIETDGITCKPLTPKDAGILDFATLLEYEDRYDQVGENYVNVAATTCFAVKRSVFRAMHGFVDYTSGEATGEDWDFGLRMSKKGYRIFHTNKIGVLHRHTSKGLWDYLKRQYMHARYRVTHKRRYVRYTDEYASTSMFITSTLLLCAPVIVRMHKKVRSLKLLVLMPISFLRSFVWLIGFVDGTFFDRR
jgi:GT2 family glycosyltransferase